MDALDRIFQIIFEFGFTLLIIKEYGKVYAQDAVQAKFETFKVTSGPYQLWELFLSSNLQNSWMSLFSFSCM